MNLPVTDEATKERRREQWREGERDRGKRRVTLKYEYTEGEYLGRNKTKNKIKKKTELTEYATVNHAKRTPAKAGRLTIASILTLCFPEKKWVAK